MEVGLEKEVYFAQYCPDCQHVKLEGEVEPCSECIGTPVRAYTHKPINFEKAEEECK